MCWPNHGASIRKLCRIRRELFYRESAQVRRSAPRIGIGVAQSNEAQKAIQQRWRKLAKIMGALGRLLTGRHKSSNRSHSSSKLSRPPFADPNVPSGRETIGQAAFLP